MGWVRVSVRLERGGDPGGGANRGGGGLPGCARVGPAVSKGAAARRSHASVAAQRGTSFDPRVVDILERRYVEFEAMARSQPAESARLSTGVRIENGTEPAAGLEPSAAAPTSTHAGFHFLDRGRATRVSSPSRTDERPGNSLRVDETLALLAARLKAIIPYQGVAIYTIEMTG